MQGLRGGKNLPAPAHQEPMQGVRGGGLRGRASECKALMGAKGGGGRPAAAHRGAAGRRNAQTRAAARFGDMPIDKRATPANPSRLEGPIVLARQGSAGVTQRRGAATAKVATATVAAPR